MKTTDTQQIIKNDLKDQNIRIACIGPAGENQIKIASIINEWRAVGRKGLGAVMGAKKLKALVFSGTRPIKPHDREAVHRLSRKCNRWATFQIPFVSGSMMGKIGALMRLAARDLGTGHVEITLPDGATVSTGDGDVDERVSGMARQFLETFPELLGEVRYIRELQAAAGGADDAQTAHG